jgi:hypothetical protein
MKKLIVILAIVAIASPVMAAVTISGTKVGSVITINYAASGPNSVRAFAMDIVPSTGTITAVNCTSSQPLGYYIYPGSIQIQSGSIAGYGNCVCSSTYPGTLPGLNTTSGVTVELGSLYTGTTKPASSGQILTLTLSNSAASVVVSRNTGRGGVVMERPEEAAADNLPRTIPTVECLYVGRTFPATKGFTGMTVTSTHMAKWNFLGQPNCWCCVGQKRGNNTYTGASANRPDTVDLTAVKSTNVWFKFYTQAGYLPCADVDFSGRIDTTDLTRIKSTNNYMQSVGGGPPCP